MTKIVRRSEITTTARTLQVSGMFDIPPSPVSEVTWDYQLPIDERAWNVGLIVGPSGAGKSTIARETFGEAVVTDFDWPHDRSVLDAFPSEMSIKEVVGFMTSVGFGSPPSWFSWDFGA